MAQEQIQPAQTWDSALHLHLSHGSDALLQVGRVLGRRMGLTPWS